MCWFDLPNIRVMVTGQGRDLSEKQMTQPSNFPERKRSKALGNNRKNREDTGTEWWKGIHGLDPSAKRHQGTISGDHSEDAGSVKSSVSINVLWGHLPKRFLGEKDSVVKFLWETCMLWFPLGGPQSTLIDFICRDWMGKKEQRLLK